MLQASESSAVLDRLRGHRDSVYASGKVLGAFGKTIDAFPTGMTRERGQQLADLLRDQVSPGGLAATIETGLGLGLSSLFIIETLLNHGTAESVHHTAIDPFQRSDWNDAGHRMVSDAGVQPYFTLLREDSALALPRLATEGRRFDAALVDGSHLFDGAFIDVFYMLRLVRPGGLIIVDDLWMPSVRTALSFFATNFGIEPIRALDGRGRTVLAAIRVPEQLPQRKWDHFVPFAS